MKIYIVIGLILLIILIIFIILIIQYNKFQLLIIKISKGEQNISTFLEEKYHILIRYSEILKNNIKIKKDDFDEFTLLNTRSSIYKLDKKIKEMNNIINRYLDNNEKIIKNNNIIKINKELNEVNMSLNGCKKYFNNNLIDYNNLCSSFPSKIIANLFHYQKKEFIDENIKDELKILNDNDEEV